MLNPRVFRDAAKRIHAGQELYVHSAIEEAIWAFGLSGLEGMEHTKFFKNVFDNDSGTYYCCTHFYNPYLKENKNTRILALLFAADICEIGGL